MTTSLSGSTSFLRLIVVLVLGCLGALSASPALAGCNHNGVCNPNNDEDCETCPDDCDPPPTIEVAQTQTVVGQALLFTGWGVADQYPAWNWGDGSPSAFGSPMPHTFQQPGAYDVIFTGTDNMCDTVQDSDPVTIHVSAETCNGDGVCDPTETCGGCPGDCDPLPSFTMSPNPAVVGQIVTFTGDQPAPGWDLGNGQHNLGSNPLHYAYPEPGYFPVIFTASDPHCGTTQDSLPQWLVVDPGVPVCNGNTLCDVVNGENCLNCPSDCLCGPECDLDGDCDEEAGETCSNCAVDCDPPPTLTVSTNQGVVNHPIIFEGFGVADASPGWDFGNGTHANGNPFTYAYPQPGAFDVKFTGTDSSCGTTQDSLPVRVTIAAEPYCPLEVCEDAAEIVDVSFPSSLCQTPATATVTVRNSGTTTWSEAAGYRLGSLTDPSPFSTANRVLLPPNVQVPPGQSYTFTVTLDRLPAAGTWQPSWRMVREYVTWFGGVARPVIEVQPGCGGGGGPGGGGDYHCRGTVKDAYDEPLAGRRVLLIAERWLPVGDPYEEIEQAERFSKIDGSFHVSVEAASAIVARITCRVFPLRKSRPGEPTKKMLTQNTGLPLGTTLELDVVEAPAPSNTPHAVLGERPPSARVGLYRRDAYDKALFIAEPLNPTEQKTGYWTLDDLWFEFEPYMQKAYEDGVDVWLFDTPRSGYNIHEQAAELAQGIEWAARGYPASLPGGAPNFNGNVVLLGVSLGGIVSRVATARWDSPAASDEQWRQTLSLTPPLPVSKVVFLDAPLQGAQVNRDLQDFLWNPPTIFTGPMARLFNLNSCAFQQLIFESTVGLYGSCTPSSGFDCNRKAFFEDGAAVGFPGSGTCDVLSDGVCHCNAGPAVQSINGNGFPNVPIVAYSDGKPGEDNQCYGDYRDLNRHQENVCPNTVGALVPHVPDTMVKFRIDTYPDADMKASSLDLVPGSRHGADLSRYHFSFFLIDVSIDQYFSGTFMPVTSSRAHPDGGCGPPGDPFVECRDAGFSGTHVNPDDDARQWLVGQINQAFGQPVGALPPSARMEAPPAGGPGDPIAFDGTASTDPDGQLIQHRWDFGDGSVQVGGTAAHSFASAGVHDVRLTVTDNTGRTDTTSRRVRVGPPNQPPKATMALAPTALVGYSLALDASASKDPDGSIHRYVWSFGDGTLAEGAAATHAFGRSGRYLVGLTVTDDEQLEHTSFQEIVVTEPSWQETPVPSAPIGCAGSPRPVFSWAGLDWATHYALQVRSTASAALLFDERAVATTSFQPAVDLPANSSLRWRVRACNAMGCGAWSAEQAFTTTCSGPPAPTPIAPQGCVINAQPTLSWTAVAGATGYELTVERAFDGLLILNPRVSSTSFQVPSPLSAYTEYRFRVRALGGTWSTYRYFMTYCLPELAGTASPLEPANATYGVLPLFQWEAASNTTDYQIEVTSPGVGAFASGWYPGATHCNANGRCATTLSAPLIGGPSSWRIRTRNTAGLGPWSPPVAFTVVGTLQSQWALAAAADFDADGKPDLVWQDTLSGDVRVWLMNGASRRQVVDLQPGNAGGPDWEVAGAGDFNGDGKPDLIWQQRITSELLVWYMNGTARLGIDTPYPDRPANNVQSWKVQALGDYDFDGKTDILWQHQTEGYLVAWLMDGVRQKSATAPNPNRPASDFANWKVATTELPLLGSRDNHSLWMWQHQTAGWLVSWQMLGLTRDATPAVSPNVPEGDAANWKLAASADMNGDGKLDLIFRNRATGGNLVWTMNGTTRLGTMPLDFY